MPTTHAASPPPAMTVPAATTAAASSHRQFNKGIYVPIVTPFHDNEDIDHDALAKHVVRIGAAGAGIVVQGTTAEGATTNDGD